MQAQRQKKLRIDNLLVERGFFESRERAQRAIMAGDVRVGERAVAKSSELVETDVSITLAERRQYASRGSAAACSECRATESGTGLGHLPGSA